MGLVILSMPITKEVRSITTAPLVMSRRVDGVAWYIYRPMLHHGLEHQSCLTPMPVDVSEPATKRLDTIGPAAPDYCESKTNTIGWFFFVKTYSTSPNVDLGTARTPG
jgi:hypothetical protein